MAPNQGLQAANSSPLSTASSSKTASSSFFTSFFCCPLPFFSFLVLDLGPEHPSSSSSSSPSYLRSSISGPRPVFQRSTVLSFPPAETNQLSLWENLTLVMWDECPIYDLCTYLSTTTGYLNILIFPISSPVQRTYLLFDLQTVLISE